MEDNKTPRKRVANFTADEKALLAQLIKKRPIIETKFTDGKSIVKKKMAWGSVTEEFNCNAHVTKRDTITLKRAWDNLKAMTRKARATERGNLIKTGGGPSDLPPTSQQGAIISMVEEAAPVIICEVQNTFDSDGTVLLSIENSQKENVHLEDFEAKLENSQTDTVEPEVTLEQNIGRIYHVQKALEVNRTLSHICLDEYMEQE
ncbi:unnamed protein product [Diatraea saccharalis]|uniref:Regulatory protein zeste n=1 Tax=Diatraea saccharalis TaxID=40085 RepID=A0A9N9R364_9NEOP|nr:unnamed protein product [Diatraea saccharalis]